MGACAAVSHLKYNDNKELESKALGASWKIANDMGRTDRESFGRKPARVNFKDRLQIIERENVLFNKCSIPITETPSTEQSIECFRPNIDPTSSLNFIDQPVTESESTESESSSLNSSLFSYDGLNTRANNRYDIGLEILKAEISLGADPKDLCTHGDRSCLMFAVLANDFSFVKHLVELGVNVNQTNGLGETALGFAIELQRYDMAKYLRSKGAADVVIKVY
jgi:hypothetical protein